MSHVYKIALKNILHLFLIMKKSKGSCSKDKKSTFQYFSLWNFDVRREKKFFFLP